MLTSWCILLLFILFCFVMLCFVKVFPFTSKTMGEKNKQTEYFKSGYELTKTRLQLGNSINNRKLHTLRALIFFSFLFFFTFCFATTIHLMCNILHTHFSNLFALFQCRIEIFHKLTIIRFKEFRVAMQMLNSNLCIQSVTFCLS